MNYSKEDIIKELELQSLPAEMQEQIVNTVYQTFQLRIVAAFSDKLTDEQIDTFNALSDEGDELDKWIEQTIPDYKDVIANEMQTVLAEIKQSAANMTKDL